MAKKTDKPATPAATDASAKKAKKSSTKPAKKESASKKVAPPTEPKVDTPKVDTPKVEPPKDQVVEENVGQELSLAFGEFMTQLTTLRTLQAKVLTDFRSLQKRTEREIKAAQKANSKRKRKPGNRAPSGFVKPTLISDQLADFLGKAHGSELARTEVTREINQYIRANSLQDKDNGRIIKPDAKLKALLGVKDSEELTYFNLQKFMSPHFQKATPAVPAAASK
tara:strand:- start:1025 stop:1696 length:672 start_codon:yes stop_codon:yes gene_type:complete